jgi:hypothetical protein
VQLKAEVVLSSGNHGFQAVVDDMANAERIYVLTFNISEKGSDLLHVLNNAGDDTEITIVTNIPKRFTRYFGSAPKTKARSTIRTYMKRLNPKIYEASVRTYFHFDNHAKLVATENIAYVGSANFSDESSGNYEAGFLVRGRTEVAAIINAVFEPVRSTATEFIPDDEAGIKVPLNYARDRIEAATQALEEHFVAYPEHDFARPAEPQVVGPQGGTPGTGGLDEAYYALMELLEPGQFSLGAEHLLRGRLDQNKLEEFGTTWGDRTPLGDLLRFDFDDYMHQFIEDDRDAFDENLAAVQDEAQYAAQDKLDELFDRVGSDGCKALLQGLNDLSGALDGAESDLDKQLEARQEIDNTV